MGYTSAHRVLCRGKPLEISPQLGNCDLASFKQACTLLILLPINHGAHLARIQGIESC